MKRNARFAAVISLAGTVLVSSPGTGLAENTPWRFASVTNPLTDEVEGAVLSDHINGGTVGFGCDKGGTTTSLVTAVSTQKFDQHPRGQVEVSWRIDNGPVRNQTWIASKSGGVGQSGQIGYDFAVAVMRAQTRIVFRNANGTVVFDATGSTKAISQLLEFCGLKQ